MATFLFDEKYSGDKVTAKAVFLPKKKMFFAKYLPENIELLAEIEPIKKGFIVRPNCNLLTSVTGLHKGDKGCCRILFAREDRKKDGGKNLGFAKVAKQNLLRQLNKIGGKLLHISTGAKHALLYADEVLVASSLTATSGSVVKKSDLFRSSNSTENEAYELLTA